MTGAWRLLSAYDLDASFGVESPAYVAIRFLQFTAVTLLIGGVAFRLAVIPRFERMQASGWRPASIPTGITVPWLWRSLLLFAMVHLARLAAQHRVYFAADPWSVGTMRPLLLESGWGTAWLLAFGAMLAAMFALHHGAQHRRAGWWALVASLVLIAWTMGMSGHPAAAPLPRVAIAVDTLHIIGAGGWLGSLTWLMLTAVPHLRRSGGTDRSRRTAQLVAAFSPTALAFAALLGATGAVASWRNVGTVSGLFSSAYGTLLLLKLAAVGIIAGLGAYSWRRVLPSLEDERAQRALRRSAGLELLVGLLVLLISAALVATEAPAT